MDELAILAGTDPVEFRLKHLQDPRGIDVINCSPGTALPFWPVMTLSDYLASENT